MQIENSSGETGCGLSRADVRVGGVYASCEFTASRICCQFCKLRGWDGLGRAGGMLLELDCAGRGSGVPSVWNHDGTARNLGDASKPDQWSAMQPGKNYDFVMSLPVAGIFMSRTKTKQLKRPHRGRMLTRHWSCLTSVPATSSTSTPDRLRAGIVSWARQFL
jgi:hypothetical protein